MSTRNPKQWTAVRDIVRRAQETLSLLHVCRVNRLLSHYYSPPPPGTSYPQSLGELCIELAQQRNSDIWYGKVKQAPRPLDPHRTIVCEISWRDIQELRRAMYHKHKDPAKERETARAERLINLIRFV